MPQEPAALKLSLLNFVTTSTLPAARQGVIIEVPDSYLSDDRFQLPGVEGLAIQRLITLAQRTDLVQFIWSAASARRVISSPAVLPLAAVALCLNNSVHRCSEDQTIGEIEFGRARQSLLAHKLDADMFSDRQILICLDYQRPSLPSDLPGHKSRYGGVFTGRHIYCDAEFDLRRQVC